MEDVEKMIEATDRLSGVNTERELHFRKGELSILNWLKGLKGLTNDVYEELKNG